MDKTALISVKHHKFLCSAVLVGAQVQVRYHPARLDQPVQFWQHDRFLQLAFPYVAPERVPHENTPLPARARQGARSLPATASGADGPRRDVPARYGRQRSRGRRTGSGGRARVCRGSRSCAGGTTEKICSSDKEVPG